MKLQYINPAVMLQPGDLIFWSSRNEMLGYDPAWYREKYLVVSVKFPLHTEINPRVGVVPVHNPQKPPRSFFYQDIGIEIRPHAIDRNRYFYAKVFREGQEILVFKFLPETEEEEKWLKETP